MDMIVIMIMDIGMIGTLYARDRAFSFFPLHLSILHDYGESRISDPNSVAFSLCC